jgi:hypothetical protein
VLGGAGSRSALRALSPQPAALRASTFPLQGKVENIVAVAVTIILTIVPDSVTYNLSRSPKDAFRRQAERWSGCGARGWFCTLLSGGLGIMSPGITTGVGGASLDWDRRRRVTPVQTASQEAWPEAEPLGWNNSLR